MPKPKGKRKKENLAYLAKVTTTFLIPPHCICNPSQKKI
jgi:hypothetical protein